MPPTIEKMPLVASTNLLGSGAIELLLAISDVTIAALSQRSRVCKKTITISEFYFTRAVASVRQTAALASVDISCFVLCFCLFAVFYFVYVLSRFSRKQP